MHDSSTILTSFVYFHQLAILTELAKPETASGRPSSTGLLKHENFQLRVAAPCPFTVV